MTETDIKLSPGNLEIILSWTGVSILSIFSGILFGAFLNDFLWSSDVPLYVGDNIIIDMFIDNPIQRACIFGLSIGGVKSLLERSVLRKWEIKWNGWVIFSMLGWALGVIIAQGLAFFHPYFGFDQLLGGMVIGLSQWIILRRYLPKAYWWIITNIIGSFAILNYIPLGYTFSMMAESFIAFIGAGFFMGIMTSATLSWLLNLSCLEEMEGISHDR